MNMITTTLAALLPAASAFAQQPQAGAQDIRDLHPAITIPTEVVPDHVWIWLTLGCFALGGFTVWLVRSLRSRVAVRSAAELARKALADAEIAIVQNQNPVQATALLESAVRDYLYASFDLPADTRTTAEIALLLRGAADGQPLLTEFSGRLLRLLHTCEGAVFAREPVAPGEWTEMTTTFYQLIARREAELAARPKESVADAERAEPPSQPNTPGSLPLTEAMQ